MEYGILIAEDFDGHYQIVGAVASRDEARELANNYCDRGPAEEMVAPERFIIHRRGQRGWYNEREVLA